MNIKEIHIAKTFEQSTHMEYRITRNMDSYEEHSHFYSEIIVKRDRDSKSQSFTLVDGYSAYIAAKELGLKVVDVVEVE